LLLGIAITPDGAVEIARRSRGTPRVAGRLLRRVRDFAIVAGKQQIDKQIADSSLSQLDVDQMGLDMMDRRYLRCIGEKYAGGPVGADTLAAALSEERDTIEEVIEPYLLQEGFVQRTPRGRVLTAIGFSHLGLRAPAMVPTLFDEGDDK
jgi:Holliday junction DNA helicase RuvB